MREIERERERERESKRENKREERSRKATVLTIFLLLSGHKISLIVEYKKRQMKKDVIKRDNPMLVNALDIKFYFCHFFRPSPANCFKFQREREREREGDRERKRNRGKKKMGEIERKRK